MLRAWLRGTRKPTLLMCWVDCEQFYLVRPSIRLNATPSGKIAKRRRAYKQAGSRMRKGHGIVPAAKMV